MGNNPVNFNDPMGLVQWSDAGVALFDMAVNGAGVVGSSFLIGTGATMIAAPEPLSTLAGAGVLTAGLTGYGASTIGFGVSAGNFVTALADKQSNAPTVTEFYSNFLPDSPYTEPGLNLLFFTADLVGGRVGGLPSSLDAMSTISDIGSVSNSTTSIINSVDSLTGGGASNFLQDTFSPNSPAPKFNDFGSPYFNFGNSANGGFVLYPNKINTNITNSVYSK